MLLNYKPYRSRHFIMLLSVVCVLPLHYFGVDKTSGKCTGVFSKQEIWRRHIITRFIDENRFTLNFYRNYYLNQNMKMYVGFVHTQDYKERIYIKWRTLVCTLLKRFVTVTYTSSRNCNEQLLLSSLTLSCPV